MSNVPIEDHAFLSDCSSAALVTRDGSVDWLCLPRFDSPAVLARLLDDGAGHLLLRPVERQSRAQRRYLPQTLVLDTFWTCASGRVLVRDALALGSNERGHELGLAAPGVLLRQAICVDGEVDMALEWAPRPEFGLVHPRLDIVAGGVRSVGGSTVTLLSVSAPMTATDAMAQATVRLRADQELSLSVQQADAWAELPHQWSPERICHRIDDTVTAWRSWSDLHQRYDGPLRDLVNGSGLVLQGLTFARSGAIAAAATTSLPEGVGTGRTWDYRFPWVRDASMTMRGLWVAACPDEAQRFFAFLARGAGTQLERGLHLQIMYGLGGERDLTERERRRSTRSSRACPTTTACCTATGPTTDWKATKAPSCSAPSGSSRPSPRPAGRSRLSRCCGARPHTPTTSGYWPNRSTATPARCWATFRRRSVTWAWFWPARRGSRRPKEIDDEARTYPCCCSRVRPAASAERQRPNPVSSAARSSSS